MLNFKLFVLCDNFFSNFYTYLFSTTYLLEISSPFFFKLKTLFFGSYNLISFFDN